MQVSLTDPRFYQPQAPENMRLVGVVTRDSGEQGALTYITNTRVYVQLNGGTARTLDQREVKRALLRAYREKAGMTQAEAADFIGVYTSAYEHWEQDRRQVPRYALQSLSRAAEA